MLRRPAPHTLIELISAATSTDVDLDLALLRLGILAPASLDEIRAVLDQPGIALAASENRDGHRIVEISVDEHRVALLHHDGRLQHVVAVAA